MAPKKQDKTQEQKAQERARQKEKEKRAEDKTFGLKNKNKSKVVQQQVKQIQNSAKVHGDGRRPKDEHTEKKESAAKAKQAALLAGYRI